MASVTPNRSPFSSPSSADIDSALDEQWQMLGYASSLSASGSTGFSPWALLGNPNETTSQPSVSPASFDPLELVPPAAFASPDQNDQSANAPLLEMDDMVFGFDPEPSTDPFMTPQRFLFSSKNGNSQLPNDASLMTAFQNESQPGFQSAFQPDLFLLNQNSAFPGSENVATQTSFQQDASAATMSCMLENAGVFDPQAISFESWVSDNPVSGTSLAASPQSPTSARSIPVKVGPSSSSSSSSPASLSLPSKSQLILHKVKDGKIEKKKGEAAGQFVIMTPSSINAQVGRPNRFECPEVIRASQRGRKGPLANDIKEDALLVRRRGACFCCHSRKVKCDKERPCKHCKRLMLQVPQVVCWQFQDFIPYLFPGFMRSHFKKQEMAEFLRDNVESFQVGGFEQACEVELFSGQRFSAVLTVKAKFFTPRTCDVLQHWHLNPAQGQAYLESNGSAPIGIDFQTSTQRDELRKKARAYVREIVNDPIYADQITDSLKRNTDLPTKLLRIIQRYAQQSDSPMVQRALSMYAMHYIMTRHLCITPRSVYHLQHYGPISQNNPWVTPRVLARQVKSLIDELILRETQHIFELFSKSLKPKHRREWAPCTAAFLVLCLFMEAVETTAENFATSQNEVNRMNTSPLEYASDFAGNICKELENMPFKQFAYQFHSIYQTHAKDANTKAFNPFFDDSVLEHGELDGPAVEMVQSMRGLFRGNEWPDLQFLADDEAYSNWARGSRPNDSSFLYTGRLVSKFLLSFINESIIFGSQS